MIHSRVHEENKFHCDECGWSFTSIDVLARHGRGAHDSRPFYCKECVSYFWSLEDLISHEKEFHEFECFVCHQTFPMELELEEHKMDAHGGDVPTTEEQEELTRIEASRERNVRREKGRQKRIQEAERKKQKHFGCQWCVAFFSKQSLLDNHISKVHCYKCQICERICPTENKLNLHMLNAHRTVTLSKEQHDEDRRLRQEFMDRTRMAEKRRWAEEWDKAEERQKKKKRKKTKYKKDDKDDNPDDDPDYLPEQDRGDDSIVDATYRPSKKELRKADKEGDK